MTFPTDEQARLVADALVASPAVAPVAVSVKGLEWWTDNVDWWAYPYRIRKDAGTPDLYIVSGWSGVGTNPYDTLEAAKAAAQSDFNARILSSIIPATKGGEDAGATQILRRFADQFRSGEQGADMDCDAAEALAKAIDAAIAQDTDGVAKT